MASSSKDKQDEKPAFDVSHSTYDAVAEANKRAAKLAKRHAKPPVKVGGLFVQRYVPSGAKVCYADNKVGILPDLESVLHSIALEAGVDMQDSTACSTFIEAMVTDVYVNAYSDKQPFDGYTVVGEYKLPRRCIKAVLDPLVGTAYRRFARAMAPLVVQVMHDNYEAFGELLDKRCSELNLSTRAEAVKQFDGADALIRVDRESAKRAAEVKHLALSMRSTHRAYTLQDSAKSSGNHSI